MNALAERLRQMRSDASLNADEAATLDEAIALIAEHERVLAERAAPQEWEYGERNGLGGVWTIDPEISPELWKSIPAELRARRRPAGPWEPLPEDTNQTEGGPDA